MEASLMDGKTILITGATDGIGRQTAKELAQMGGRVILVGRNEAKCQETIEEILEISQYAQISYLCADLSIMGEVKRLAEEFRSKFDRLDVLINNAGASFLTRRVTIDGFEKTFALNHLAYFLLTNLLIDMLRANAPSRVINTSSGSHYSGKINFSNPHLKYQYLVYNAYSQSKLANVMFTYALARKLEGSGVTVNCMHPGLVRTGIFRKVVGRTLEKLFIRNAIPVEEGAETLVYLASARDLTYENGSYYYKKKVRTTSDNSYDVDAQDRLWSMSEEMLKPWLRPELLGD